MNLQRIFEPSGLNWWIVVSGMGMNFFLTAGVLLGATALADGGLPDVVYLFVLCGGAFLAPLLTAYLCGRMTGERFLTYGLYPLVGFLIIAVPGVLASGLIGLLVVGFGILGALNGASLAARRAYRLREDMRRRMGLDNSEEDDG